MKNLFILLFLTIISCKNNDVNYESIVKNDGFRKEILSKKGGAFIELSKGFTYYHEENSSSNLGTILLIHGFSVPSYIWEPTLKRLSSSGYRVVTMDLYGRGYSSNPDLPQTDNLRAN